MIGRRHLECGLAFIVGGCMILLINNLLTDRFKEQELARLSGTVSSNPSSVSYPNDSNQQEHSVATLSNNSEPEHLQRHAAAGEVRLQARTLVQHLPFSMSEEHRSLLLAGDNTTVFKQLLEAAANAVRNDQSNILGKTIAQLASVSLLQRDVEAATVYLQEALDIFELADDELGQAGVQLLQGQLNIESRWQAREAAYAYEDLQLAGWKIAKDRVDEAIPQLERAIASNLQLNRYGAAASAYELLYKGHLKNNRVDKAITAATEAARLHASSGRMLAATDLLNRLVPMGLDEGAKQSVALELIGLQAEYEDSIRQIGRASDYEQLYHHYIDAGDPVRAWQFRLKSQSALDSASRLAMARRQTGVLALLYNSNDDMKKATQSLNKASQVFSDHSAEQLQIYSDSLREEIY